jgi:hypothetical protein
MVNVQRMDAYAMSIGLAKIVVYIPEKYAMEN